MSKTLRNGRYVIESALGEGGQGTTYIARDTKNDVRVAVKRFRVGKAKQWKDVELAEREAKTLAALDHHRLPHYVEHFEEDGSLVLVMELIEGTSLAAIRKEGKTASITDVERLLDDAQAALDYLHSRVPPVIHRDIKPANVIKRKDGSYAFVDFGSVRDRLKPAGGSTVVGTFGYMAPEQFQGRASPATDVFGVGATALALLTGTEPEELPHKGLAIDVRAAVPKTTPPWLVNALERMLNPDPDLRAQSIADALVEGTRTAHKSSRPPPSEGESAREARHRERKERRAERRAQRRGRRGPRGRVPLVPRLFAHLGIAIAQLVVFLTVGVVVPVLLFVLSILFGKALRRAAASCVGAQANALRAMNRTHARLDGRNEEEPDDDAMDEVEERRARIADDVLRNVQAVSPEQAQALAIQKQERARRTTEDPEEWAAEKARIEAEKWAGDERVRDWEERRREWEEAEDERIRAAEQEKERRRKMSR